MRTRPTAAAALLACSLAAPLLSAGPVRAEVPPPPPEHCAVIVVHHAADGELVTTEPFCSTDQAVLHAVAAVVAARAFTLGVHYDLPALRGPSFSVFGDDCTGGFLNLSTAWINRVGSTDSGCPRVRHWDSFDCAGDHETLVGRGGSLRPLNNRARLDPVPDVTPGCNANGGLRQRTHVTMRRRDRALAGPGPDGDVDGWLLQRARTDVAAFGEFFDRNHQSVLRYFVSQTRDPHLAGELMAETFAQALSSLHTYEGRRGLGVAWLFGIAAHQHRRYLRRGAVDRRHRLTHRIPALTKSDDDLERIEATMDLLTALPSLHGALDQLSPAVRAAVELRVGHDLPYAEVASRLGCTEGSARVRVARGMKQLMAAMGVEGSA